MQGANTDTPRKRISLTPKQGQFAALVARGVSLTVSYSENYDTQASGTCLRVQAWRLSRNPKVSERIQELREGSLQARLTTGPFLLGVILLIGSHDTPLEEAIVKRHGAVH